MTVSNQESEKTSMPEHIKHHPFNTDGIPYDEISDPAVLLKNPLVSVKMITYNHGPYIAQAIEGVIKQKTEYSFELIIGEDCSTDETMEIILEYQKKYPEIIRIVTSDKNVGMKKNSYRTIKACRGKYIAFCEGDDYWHRSDKLQKQVNYLQNHPECGMVYSSYDVYHVASKKRIENFIKYREWRMPKNPCISDFLKAQSEIGFGITTCTVIARRTLINQIIDSDQYLYQSDYFLMGDTQLWAEMSTMAHLHYIPESLATHNIMVESATQSKDIRKKLQFSVSNEKLILYLCDKYDLPSSTKNLFKEALSVVSLRLSFYDRNAKLADEVKMKKKKFTWKQWMMYYGAKYTAMYYFCRLGTIVLGIFRKDENRWL